MLIDFYSSSLTGKVNLRHYAYNYGIDEIIHEGNNYCSR